MKKEYIFVLDYLYKLVCPAIKFLIPGCPGRYKSVYSSILHSQG